MSQQPKPVGTGGHKPINPEEAVEADDGDFVRLNGCRVMHRTAKAVRVWHDGEEFWVPLSVLRDGRVSGSSLEVREWFARRHELI